MEEFFIEYVLNTLDPVTRARVDAHLLHHPEAKVRLQSLELAFAPLADDVDSPDLTPPPGLVLNTLAFIAEHQCHHPAPLPAAPAPTRQQLGTPSRSWRRVDWLVAALLLIVVGAIGFPLLARQWNLQRRAACGDNMRRMWVALSAYSDRASGEFPRVEEHGSASIAGIFMPMLTDCGLASDVSIQCPANGHRPPQKVTLTQLERTYRDAPEEYRLLSQELAGDYAYSLGYQENGVLRGLRRASGDGLPILADRSNAVGNSHLHGGSGQNVLYIGGHVHWCTEPTVGVDRDHIYVNHHYRVLAGVSRSDSVLGASDARPFGVE